MQEHSTSHQYSSSSDFKNEAQFPPIFDLTTLNGTNGFMIVGSPEPLCGYVGTLGDFNGDGIDDFVVRSQTMLYLIFGQASGWSSKFDLTTLHGNNGFVIEGMASLFVGGPITAGDFNGDGKSDLVALDARKLYVIFGQASDRWSPKFNLTTLNGTNGFVTEGISAVQVGAGDFNGDGKADILVGNCWANPGGRYAAGAAYVIFGQAGPFPAILNLSNLNGTNGFVIEGLNARDWFGHGVSTAGDINADGKEDILVGANGYNQPTDRAYVILGQASGWPATLSLATLNGTNGFTIESGLPYADQFGFWVNNAGDFNGDGIDDLAVGAPLTRRSSDIKLSGAGYVLFGQTGPFPAILNLSNLNGTNGFIVEGLAANDVLGYFVSTAGDLNGDGKADLTILSVRGQTLSKGYVIFGQASGMPSHFNLTTLNGINGFKIPGDNLFIDQLPTAGDINGDGKDDLVIGCNLDQDFVIFGQASGQKVNRPPIVVHAIPDQPIEVGTPFNFKIASDTFVDPDAESLTYSAQQADGSPLPSWVSFDAKSLFFSGVASLAGNTSLSVEATDTDSLSIRANFGLLATQMISPSPSNPLTPSNTPSISLGIFIGGIIGGVAGGFACAMAIGAYLAKKRGFFAKLYKNLDKEYTLNKM